MINKKNYFSLFLISLIVGGLIALLSMVGENSNKNNSPPTYNPTKSELLDIVSPIEVYNFRNEK